MARGAELGGELSAERVEFGDEVEVTLAVKDDLLNERAGPGRLVYVGDVDAAFPVEAGEGMDEGGLAGCVRAFYGDDLAVTDRHRASQQFAELGVCEPGECAVELLVKDLVHVEAGVPAPEVGAAERHIGGRQPMTQVQDGNPFAGRRIPVVEPDSMQSGHGGSSQF